MKSRITKAVIIIALMMAITITVSAIGKWVGSEYVEESHTYITQIRELFNSKNDEIKKLKEDNEGYDKVIEDLQKEIMDKNKVIEAKDEEIAKVKRDLMNAKATIKIQKDELDYALQDVKAIRDELKELVDGEQ